MSCALVRRRVGFATTSVILLGASSAFAVTGPASPGAAPIPHTTVSGDYLTQARLHAQAAGMTVPEPTVGGRPAGRPVFRVYPVDRVSVDQSGDVSGDGRGDLLAVHHSSTRTVVTFRKGSTGRLLWSFKRPHLIGLTVAPLGPQRRPGVLVAWASTDGIDTVLSLGAYRGSNGSTLWTWNSAGFDDRGALIGSAGVRLPYLVGLLGAARKPLRVVTTLETGRRLNELRFVSGRDGSSWSGPVLSEIPQQYGSIGDVDGDRLADLFLYTPPLVQAFSSATGSTLWRRVLQRPDLIRGDLLPISRGSGARDLYLYRTSRLQEGYHTPCLNAEVLSGADGLTRWRRGGRCGLTTLGDANRDGVTDLMPSEPRGSRIDRIYAVSGSTGKTLWSRPSDQHWFWGCDGTSKYQSSYNVGVEDRIYDVNGDGVRDFRLEPKRCPARRELVLDGRTGTPMPGPVLARSPLGAAVDGHGDDFARIDDVGPYSRSRTLKVVAQDGRSRDILWASNHRRTQPMSWSRQYAAPLTADRQAEVVVMSVAYPDTWDVVVFDGATGDELWSWISNS